MSPSGVSVNSCADAGGQRGSMKISTCFVKEICHGRCTQVGAKVVENILSLPVAH